MTTHLHTSHSKQSSTPSLNTVVSRETNSPEFTLSQSNAIGIGLRAAHHNTVETRLANRQISELGWLEIHSENYLNPTSELSISLNRIADQIPISCHGVGLSLGSVEEPHPDHLRQLVALEQRIQPILISDHLSWSQSGGVHYNDLLPLPYTEEALDVFCRNVDIVQSALGRSLLIENPSSYLRFAHSTISEWEFLNEVHARTGCRLLLDLNNVHVSAFNHGFSSTHYLNSVNNSAVDEIHLAGFTKKRLPQGEIWIDTHNQPVSDEVWSLYAYWLDRNGLRPTLIEWDTDLPKLDVLLAEANKASDLICHSFSSRDVLSLSPA